VRVDAGVTSGDEVTLHYDPMIAKLIVLGETRDDAIARMRWALDRYVVLGDVITNIPFLRAVLAHPVFLAGQQTTDFVDTAFAGWQPPAPTAGALDLAAAIAAVAEQVQGTAASSGAPTDGDPYSPWRGGSGFRIGESRD
jgi:acetyl/propionyl-CoA carboxylase alpha subunit